MSTDRWSRPMIDRVSEFLIPSSKSKLDRRSTRPMIRYDVGGLGILAALERSERVAGSGKPANPIPVHNNYGGIGCGTGAGNGFEEMMTGFDHHVTCSNGGMNKDKSIFSLSSSPGRVGEAFPAPGFLSCCNLCRTRLCGKDIYMYRGEKAFCSEECREVQIVKDEKKQGFRSHGVSRSAGSSYVRGQRMVSTGIFAIYIIFFSSMLLTDELRSQCLLRQMILCM